MNNLIQVPPPKPGFYPDVPFAEYHSWDAISNSRLNLARESLMHFREAEPTEETPAMRLGSFLHCGVLEPIAISERYAVMPPFELDEANCTKGPRPQRSTSTSTDYYKQKKEEFERLHVGKKIVPDKEYRLLQKLALQLRKSQRCRQYLNGAETELSIVWKDPETGLTCKARFDAMLRSVAFSDLKTTGRKLSEFHSVVAASGYHRQGAFYRKGWSVLTGDVLPCGLIAAQTTRVVAVCAAPIDEDFLELGAEENAATLLDITEAYESNEWPGPVEPRAWIKPTWYDGSGDGDDVLVIGGESVSFS